MKRSVERRRRSGWAMVIAWAATLNASVAFENPATVLDTPEARAAYRVTDPQLRALALGLLATPETDGADLITPNPDPGARWWKEAGFGLFMHWGIHSVEGLQPSWAAIRGYPYGTPDARWQGMGYFRLAERFRPTEWRPGDWAPLARAAGFRYVVLTTKHHDGFALWPTRWGNFSTRQFCGGDDLVRRYVDGVRAAGLKVGFYFSPQDWHYPGYPLADVNFDFAQRGKRAAVADPAKDAADAREFFIYTIAQLHELLTGYGEVNELWFDGLEWPGQSFPVRAVYRWIRSLQPHIVINDRWARLRLPDGSDRTLVKFGDFTTHEWTELTAKPAGWWEYCRGWYGHWGYSGPFAGAVRQELERLGQIRGWDGNYLLNLGPRPDGALPKGTETAWREMATWMAVNGEAIHGTRGGPVNAANVPVTIGGDGAWYLHVFADWTGDIQVRTKRELAAASLLGVHQAVRFSGAPGAWVVPAVGRGYRIIKLEWMPPAAP